MKKVYTFSAWCIGALCAIALLVACPKATDPASDGGGLPILPSKYLKFEGSVLAGLAEEVSDDPVDSSDPEDPEPPRKYLLDSSEYAKKAIEIRVPKNVTAIKKGAFHFILSGRGSVTISFEEESYLTEIEESAIRDCQDVVAVDFTNVSGPLTIGQYAFQDCKRLERINFSTTKPDGLETHTEPDGLETYTELTSLGNQAFMSCLSLKSIDLSKTKLKVIPERAFSQCSNMTTVTLPEEVETIKKSAFYACRKLASISLPDSLKKIENWAFGYCTGFDLKKGVVITINCLAEAPPDAEAPPGLNFSGQPFEKIKGKGEEDFHKTNVKFPSTGWTPAQKKELFKGSNLHDKL